ncbi:hypothetical protein SK128_019471 [Halocaridina rubra]|uniref:Uncharacterized protein n=1 Tax=Halocaridina rubra TaxID=373956 RepID=A0AAN9A567_HALRR
MFPEDDSLAGEAEDGNARNVHNTQSSMDAVYTACVSEEDEKGASLGNESKIELISFGKENLASLSLCYTAFEYPRSQRNRGGTSLWLENFACKCLVLEEKSHIYHWPGHVYAIPTQCFSILL